MTRSFALPLPLLLAVLAPALSAQGGPPTRPPSAVVATTEPDVQGTHFWVKLYWQYKNPLPDSALTSVTVGTVQQGAQRRHRTTIVRDSVSLLRPADGVQLTGQGCVQTKRSSPADTSARYCSPWVYREPVPPVTPPIIDSVKTDTVVVAMRWAPVTTTLALAESKPVCLIAIMAGGQAGYKGPREPYCDMRASALGPPVKPIQQQKIDSMCFTNVLEQDVVSPETMTVTHSPPCSGITVWTRTS